ncbi:MAG TPA: tRNA uridine(34) 5-carboxymethylaminomethyl modification radical SAM/GNAT enzyme Elp3 [Anaerolineales bacterium]|nr:tRNA uridine(34) 5-carboxymethylaminomethyl modification radical SAM/GNAT enzyme Elp3 [Anaerolineales bacterium]
MSSEQYPVRTSTPEFLEQKKLSWTEHRAPTPERRRAARLILADVMAGVPVFAAIRNHPLEGEGGYVGKSFVIAEYRAMVEAGEIVADPALLEKIRMKPMRTLSGVTTVTVLTEPYPCPGKCIFCPTDFRMPKSYLADEPGAMRALQHNFDPYEQVRSRIESLESIGHPTDKIELLILGGTWSSYRKDYQEWFVLRCFEAMNGLPADALSGDGPGLRAADRRSALLSAQAANETAAHRNVGLVVETRPDHVDPEELAWLRYLGVTKVQMGAQSLDDRILELNHRGHTVAETLSATALLRAAGFKIVLHWMPNLLGATPASDLADFGKLWEGFCPDEIKIYPTQLLANAELYEYWQRGEYHPYSTEELVDLIADAKTTIPRYCRVNRVVRDIPSTNVVEGNRRTSLRMDVQDELRRRSQRCECVRCREVRGADISPETLRLEDVTYMAHGAEEHFISYVTLEDRLAGFLRLSLPSGGGGETGLRDLDGAAIVREVHVYGQSLPVGVEKEGAAQHIGLGTELLLRAEEIARERGYCRLAVIAAVGTRRYYEARGFRRGELYLIKDYGSHPR